MDRYNNEDDLIFRLCHDIKNPLNIIMASLLFIKEYNDFKYLDKIDKNVDYILYLCDDVLDKYKYKNNLNCKYFLFDDFILDIISDMKILYKDFKFNLVNNLSKFNIYSDEILLKEILINLLSNACKYSKNLKCVDVFLNEEIINSDTIEYSISINDYGIGIKEEVIKKIFKPFKRVDNKSEGKGLGLYIVNNLVKLLGGSISVKSSYGVGSSFILVFNFKYLK